MIALFDILEAVQAVHFDRPDPRLGRLCERLRREIRQSETLAETEAPVGDEIRNANVVRLWLDPKDGLWHGLLGPNDGRGLTAIASRPELTLSLVAARALHFAWPFDPTAKAPDPDDA